MDNDNEQWRAVPDHPDYDVSSLGRVRSWKRKNSRAMNTPLMRRAYIDKLGYARLVVDDVRAMVHQLVASAWIGPRPDGMEVDHVNHIRNDNRPDNLQYLTHQENILRQPRLLLPPPTECPSGHPYSGDNLYVRPSGILACRECNRQRVAELRNFGHGNPCSIDGCDRLAGCRVRTPNPVCEMHYQRIRRSARRSEAKEQRRSA